MAKRKSHRRKYHAAPRATHRKTSHRRRRRLSAGLPGVLQNPLIGAAIGAVGAGLIGAFISKPGATGKPMIENPYLKIVIVAGVPYLVARFAKSPAIGLGGAAVGAYELGKLVLNKTKQVIGLSDGEIEYVEKNLLNDGSTLAAGTTLTDGENTYELNEDGTWSPYSATSYPAY